MDEKSLERLMDRWASYEEDAAPKIHPAERVYRFLKAPRKKSRKIEFPKRTAIVLIGAAASIVLLVLVFQQIGSGKRQVFLRKSLVYDRGITMRGVGKQQGRGEKKGEKRRSAFIKDLHFHYLKKGTRKVQGVDVQNPGDKRTEITVGDHYRISVQLLQEKYFYFFQLTSDNRLTQLFPDKKFSPDSNPVKSGQTYYVPSQPKWFYLNKKGEQEIYFIVSEDRQKNLEDLYSKYSDTGKPAAKYNILKSILKEFSSVAEKQDENAEIFKFEFSNK
ncbi:DUF4384 domain-containing protein [candidate division KSB1 bacterium]